MASRLPLRLIPVLLCFPLMFVVEFERVPTTWLYAVKVGPGLRVADVCVIGLAALQWAAARQRVAVLRLPRELAGPALLSLGAWSLALVYGAMTGGTQLFYDWRNVALGGVVAWIVAAGVRTRDDLFFMWKAFLSFCAAFSLYSLVRYASGAGVEVFGLGSIPLYDQQTLVVLSFAGILAFSLWLSNARLGRVSPLAYGLPCIVVVLLSMRRIPWAELAIGLGLTFLLQGNVRRRLQALAVMGLIATVAVVALGPSRLGPRLQSFNPFARGTPEASTNQDHVNDILDAWDIIKASPVLGIGLGKAYRTNRIAAWKTESTLVHNGPLHVWVYYGLLGLVAYVSWHVGFFAFLLRLRRRWHAVASETKPLIYALLGGVLAWSVAVFLGRLTFLSPIYLSLQQMIVIGMIWGVVFRRSINPATDEPRFRSRPVGAAIPQR
jgi:hypothetical protein